MDSRIPLKQYVIRSLAECNNLCFCLLLLAQGGYYCQDADWDIFNRNCYYVSTSKASFTASRTACQDMGADLSSILNQAEQDFAESISYVPSPIYTPLTSVILYVNLSAIKKYGGIHSYAGERP